MADGRQPGAPTRALTMPSGARRGRGAKGGTRTLTGVTRWNLNPVRLPIPPLSQGPAIVPRLDLPSDAMTPERAAARLSSGGKEKRPAEARRFRDWWAVKDSNRATVYQAGMTRERAAARPHA
jgi:hypothetical protein